MIFTFKILDTEPHIKCQVNIVKILTFETQNLNKNMMNKTDIQYR